MIDYQRIYHVGIRVRDLEAAMAEMGSNLGVTWASAKHNPAQDIWTEADGQHTLDLRYVYSAEGPQHIELLQGPAGSLWHGGIDPGVHHLGLWCSDVGAATRECAESGWTVAAANTSPSDGYGRWSYVVPPSGTIVELVDESLLPGFEAWWAGTEEER